jgi:RNA polymerase sigma-70 factor (ECF subfamily)
MDAARRKVIHDAMVRLSDGDRAAFDTLLDELWPVILSFVERGRVSDAEDVAQEVFFKICARIADFERERDGLSWAFGIASYEIMTQRRRSKRRREVWDEASLVGQLDGSASQEEVLLQREVIAAFQHAVGALTEDDLQALGLAPRCDVSGVPNATLRKRRQRALERLRGLWRTIYGEA